MSLLVRIGVDPNAAPAPAAAPGANAKRRRERLLIGAGVGMGLLLLAALPLPTFHEAQELRSRCATLEERVAQARADAAAVRSWETGDRERAPALHAEYRRWFALERRLLETRNHVLQAARTLGLQVTDVDVTDATDSEVVHVTGKGGTAEITLLGAMLPKLDPPLRLATWEFSGSGATRDFALVAERFYEAKEAGSR